MTLPHLDDESLSAAIDGEATAAEEAHLATCSRCQAGLEALAFVAQAVGAPVAPRPAEAVDAAIRQALGDLSSAARLDSHLPAPARPFVSPPPIAPVAPVGRRRSSRSWMAGVAGIAAAVVVVAGIVSLMSRSHPSNTTALSHLSVGASGASTTVPALAPVPVPGAAAGPATRDLGEQSDAAVVAQLVTASERAAGVGPDLAVGGVTSTAARNPAASAELPAVPCVTEARQALGGAAADNGVVAFVATLRWRGQAAVVAVFSVPGGQVGVIMKTAGCSFLAGLTL